GCFEHFPSTYSRFVCPAEYKSVFQDLVRTQIIYGGHKLGSSGINFLHIGYTESGIGSWSDVVVFVTGKNQHQYTEYYYPTISHRVKIQFLLERKHTYG